MHTSKKPIGFWSAVSMGIGAMVGAGIFALLGAPQGHAPQGQVLPFDFVMRLSIIRQG